MITTKIKISEAFAGRLDPQFYNPLYFDLLHELNKCNGIRLSKIATLSSESWNQKDYFEGQFPYIEIGSIDLDSGEISNISYLPIQEAPSRAKKVVRKDDIIISTTRPNRGAISLIRVDDMMIASTGFAVIRDISNDILREYLFIVLRLKCSLTQMQQRCSGGNYPAITEDELKKIIIPLPTIATQQKIVGIYQKAQDAKQAKDAEAKALLASIDSEILEQLGISIPQATERRLSFNVGISGMIGKRMDVSLL
ncbi:MAG: restriction endonuclease subunit S, partial [Rikenellaceae bacterium]